MERKDVCDMNGKTEKKKRFAEGMCFSKMFWIFLFGCIFGAYWEEILNLVVHYHFHHELVWQLRRGVIWGPLSPVYGMGAVIMIGLLGRKKRPDWQTILYGALLGGGFEYLISFLQETFLGTVSWDYTNEFLNINGRTTIPFAIVWGLLALALIKIFYPAISSIIESLPVTFGKFVTRVLVVLVAFDFVISWGALVRQLFRHNGFPPITIVGEFFDTHFPDEVLKESYTNMVVIEVDK